MFLCYKNQPEPLSERKVLPLSYGGSVGTSKAIRCRKLIITPNRLCKRKEYSEQQQKRKEAHMGQNWFCPCFVKNHKTRNCRSALFRRYYASSRITLKYSTKYGTKGKSTYLKNINIYR